MHIQFDPRDRNACGAVIAAIIALHGELPTDGLSDISLGHSSNDDDIGGALDASEAFDAPAPETAFPPVPFVEQAPVADTAAAAAGPTATSAAFPSSVELDASGLPWDGRIHAGKPTGKIKIANGTWRKRKGVDDALVATVTAELRQAMAADGTPAVPTSPAAPVAASPEPALAPAPTAVPPVPAPTPPVADMVPGPAAATTAADVPAPPAPVAAAATFADLMRKITALQTAGKMTVADTTAIAVALGLTSVRDLVNRPDMVASFDALLPGDA